MDIIISALKTEGTRLRDQLGRVRAAIVAMSGHSNGTRSTPGRKAGTWHHSEATRRKLSLAQKRMWRLRKAGK
jgi:hypothetical protein